MAEVCRFRAYLYDAAREVVWSGEVRIDDEDYTYKTVRSRFFGDNGHSFLVREDEGEFYRGVFWLKERDDDKANAIYKMYLLKQADELEEEYEKLAEKLIAVQTKIENNRRAKDIQYSLDPSSKNPAWKRFEDYMDDIRSRRQSDGDYIS